MSRSDSLGRRSEARVSKGRIVYRERGTGEPIVFINGFGVNGDLWRNVVPRLADSYRCITPDVPLGGHEIPLDYDADLSLVGLADLMIEFLDELELDSVTLVGNDTGGGLAQVITGRHPERVSRLVLTPSDCFERTPPPVFAFLPWMAYVPGAVYLLFQSLRLRMVQRLPIAFGWAAKRPIPAETIDSYVSAGLASPAIRRDVVKICKALSSSYTQTAAEQLRKFTNPVLLVWPPEDRLFPFVYAERLAALLPNAQLVPIEDSYTFVPEDQPAILADRIAGFMRETRATARPQVAAEAS